MGLGLPFLALYAEFNFIKQIDEKKPDSLSGCLDVEQTVQAQSSMIAELRAHKRKGEPREEKCHIADARADAAEKHNAKLCALSDESGTRHPGEAADSSGFPNATWFWGGAGGGESFSRRGPFLQHITCPVRSLTLTALLIHSILSFRHPIPLFPRVNYHATLPFYWLLALTYATEFHAANSGLCDNLYWTAITINWWIGAYSN